MANITYADLMNQYAVASGFNPSASAGTVDWDEPRKYAAVQIINAALRWVCVEHDQEWLWPQLAASKTVTPASGLITRMVLGSSAGNTVDGTFCSLWTSDPAVASSTAQKVSATLSTDGVRVTDGTTSVFAYYRTATPQGTWVAGDSYSSPATIPESLREPIMLKAASLRHESEQNWQAMAMRRADADEWMNARKAGLLNRGLPWDQHLLVL